MATVTAFDAKTRFGELLERVAKGEEIVITRHDKPVARIVPEGRRSLEQVRKAVAGLRNLQDEIARGPGGKKKLSWPEFKAFVEEGRR
jgi:prevent-host-death family protein